MNHLKGVAQKTPHIVGALLFVAMLNILFWMPASAATTGVVGNGNAASCTETELATALAAGGEVTFNCGAAPHTILLSQNIDLNTNVTIDGDNKISISGNSSSRIFEIPQGVVVTLREISIIDTPNTTSGIYNSGTLIAENSTFRNNLRGAIYSAGGTVTIIDSLFEDNQRSAVTNENDGTLSVINSTFRRNIIPAANSGSGGGVYSPSGVATIVDSLFENNAARDGGGAIYNSGAMTISHTIVRNNEAYGGGGVYNVEHLIIRDSHITGNKATGVNGAGGGVQHFNQSASASSIQIIQSTIDNNVSTSQGGGMWFTGPEATLEIVNSTFYSNSANANGGGGLFVTSGDATLTNVTLSDNVSQATAGENIENSTNLPGTINLRNTLVEGGGCAGAVVDGGGNMQFPDATCGAAIPVQDPELGALAQNGGWTPTAAFSDENSPARNAGDNDFCPVTDQRGVLRQETCDVGAFEWGARPVLATISPESTIALSPTFTLLVNGSNFIPGTPATRVLWDGTPLPTTFVNGTVVRATVAASLIVAGGQVSITVETPVIDGGVSTKTIVFTIFKRDQTITFGELEDRTIEPATFNLDATASSELAVSYSATGVCSVTGNIVTLSGALGTCTITSQQAGNQSYNAAPNVVQSFDVVKHDQTIDFAKLADRGMEPLSFTISATASSEMPVTFVAAGVCTVEGNMVTLTGAGGSCTITAQQAGDDTFNPAPAVAWSFEISARVFLRMPHIFGTE